MLAIRSRVVYAQTACAAVGHVFYPSLQQPLQTAHIADNQLNACTRAAHTRARTQTGNARFGRDACGERPLRLASAGGLSQVVLQTSPLVLARHLASPQKWAPQSLSQPPLFLSVERTAALANLWLGSWLKFFAGARLAPYVATPPHVVSRLLTVSPALGLAPH